MLKKIAFEFKKNTYSLVNNFGIDLIKVSENFLDEDWSSPIELIYKTHSRHILLEVPATDIRFLSVHGYKVGKNSRAPFISTIGEYKNGEITSYENSALESFYLRFQPKSALEYLYIESSSSSAFNNLPPSGAFLPWQDINPIEQIKQRKLQIESDNREHKAIIGLDEGDPFYGPVSTEKANLEYNRLINVFDSILENGFKVDTKGKNNINAIVLEHNNNYRYFITSGQHRVAALAVLGYDKIVLQIYKGLIVRRSEVEFWPGVTNGYFNILEALAVFDRIFLGLD